MGPSQARTWYVQPPARIRADGRWSANVGSGSKQFPPKAGDKFDLMAIAVDPKDFGTRQEMSDRMVRDFTILVSAN